MVGTPSWIPEGGALYATFPAWGFALTGGGGLTSVRGCRGGGALGAGAAAAAADGAFSAGAASDA